MSFRTVVIENSAKLDYSMGFLVVRNDMTKKIHISEISTLMIASTNISLTSALLAALVKEKVKVIFCDEKRQPSSELIPYYGCHDCSGKLRKQIEWTDNIKALVWTEIINDKISKQTEFLEEIGNRSYVLLQDYRDELEIGDVTNREGHAAKVYFTALFGNDFTRSQDNSVNAALNYGYSLLLSTVNREIVLNGYNTQLGIFHKNTDNPFNLGSDIMEPFRVIVDRLVWHMKPESFETEEKHQIINMFNQEVIIDGKKEFLDNAIRIYVRSIFSALNDNDVSLIRQYRNNEL